MRGNVRDRQPQPGFAISGDRWTNAGFATGEWMRLNSGLIVATLLAGMVLLGASAHAVSQTPGSGLAMIASTALPNAPRPQTGAAAADEAQAGEVQSAQQPAQNAAGGSGQNSAGGNGAAQDGSGSQTAAQQPGAEESQHGKAEQQVKEEEHQRVLGIVPAFNTSYVWNAASLTAGQKLGLAFRAATDPFQFAAAFMVAGYHEALDEDTGFGWGTEGYFKRSGAAYLDAFDGDMIGNGILPGLLHQDPRYFRMGHGTFKHRMLYAVATNFVARHDNTHRWGPNYSNVGGNIIAGAISNLYYPSQNSGWGQTISNGMIVTAEGGLGSLFQEFWPDVSRKFLHRDVTHGLGAQAAAEDKAATQNPGAAAK